MNSHNQSTAWLLESPLAPYVDAFTDYSLAQDCYTHKTIELYFMMVRYCSFCKHYNYVQIAAG